MRRAQYIMTVLLTLACLAVGQSAQRDPPKPQCAKQECLTMCQTWRDGDPYGTLIADCQDCCDAMQQGGETCYGNCVSNVFPCGCQ